MLVPLLGCSTDSLSALPDGAEQFTPPAEYQAWWVSTEGCSAISGNFSRIKWYVVPGVSTFATEEGEKVGIRIKSGDDVSIVVAGNYVEHEMVVRHEMLHALLNQAGPSGRSISSSGASLPGKRGPRRITPTKRRRRPTATSSPDHSRLLVVPAPAPAISTQAGRGIETRAVRVAQFTQRPHHLRRTH